MYFYTIFIKFSNSGIEHHVGAHCILYKYVKARSSSSLDIGWAAPINLAKGVKQDAIEYEVVVSGNTYTYF